MQVVTHSPQETQALARRLGEHADAGHVFALMGPLGAGKTCFAQALLAGMGVTDPVISPTFNLMVEYMGRLAVVHIDAYRLADPEELLLLGFDDYILRGAVLVVEWADRLLDILPEERLDVEIGFWPQGSADSRSIQFTPRGDRHAALLARALEME